MFDIVIGNPPYNGDIYLEFIDKANKVSSNLISFITPAKWQCKQGEMNDTIRNLFRLHSKEILYFINSKDAFEINEPGGISYYLITKNETPDKIKVTNRCKRNKIFNNISYRKFGETIVLSNVHQDIVDRLQLNNQMGLEINKLSNYGRYQVWLNNKVAVGGAGDCTLLDKEGKFQCLSLSRIIDVLNITDKPDDARLIFASDSKEECENLLSFIYTKPVRFLIAGSLCGLTGIATTNNWWRLVPTIEKFDKHYTDEDIYRMWGLQENDIKVIESLIKER